jgi:hypothetical protein
MQRQAMTGEAGTRCFEETDGRLQGVEAGRTGVVVVAGRAASGCLLLLLLSSPAVAQFSGFLEDYPPLEPLDTAPNVLVWQAPQPETTYRAVYFDPPEIFLDPDSEYKGFQPNAMNTLSETLLEILQTIAVELGQTVAEVPGPNILRIRPALTNLYVTRRSARRPPISYSAFRLRAALGQGVSLVEATIEFELMDGESQRRLGVVISQEGQRRVRELDVPESNTSWSDLVSKLNRLGRAASDHFADFLVAQG